MVPFQYKCSLPRDEYSHHCDNTDAILSNVYHRNSALVRRCLYIETTLRIPWVVGWGQGDKFPCWRHQMETFSVLLAICAGNSPVPGEFPAQRPVTRSFDVFFLICAWINCWVNNREASDLRHHRAHYNVMPWERILLSIYRGIFVKISRAPHSWPLRRGMGCRSRMQSDRSFTVITVVLCALSC